MPSLVGKRQAIYKINLQEMWSNKTIGGTIMKEYKMPKLIFWGFFFVAMMMGGLFVFIIDHPLVNGDTHEQFLCKTVNDEIDIINTQSGLLEDCYNLSFNFTRIQYLKCGLYGD